MAAYILSFVAWWEAWPRHRRVGKKPAFAKWQLAVMDIAKDRNITVQEARDWLLSVTQQFADSPVGKGEYCPHPATWLYQARYEDDPLAWEDTEPTRKFELFELPEDFGGGRNFRHVRPDEDTKP